MSLGDIKNKLYKKEVEADLSSHDESEYDPKIGSGDFIQGDPKSDLWAEKQLNLNEEYKKKAIKKGAYILGGIIAIIALLVAIFFIKESLFSDLHVKTSVSGPIEIKSGDLVSYEINYENNNWMPLKDAVIKITYPENFQPENNENFKVDGMTYGSYQIGVIPRNGKGKVVLNGRMYSPKGALIYLKSDLAYSPKSYSTQYVAQGQLGINVVSSPIILEILAPQNVASGNEVNYLITYKNSGERDFENIIIRADYPIGFIFGSSEPKSLEGNNNWYIGHLSAGQEGKIVIGGKLEGSSGSSMLFTAKVGIAESGNFISYNEENTETKIAAAPFSISQTINGLSNLSVNPGDVLGFKVVYQNTGNIGLRDVIVTEKIDSQVLDYGTLGLDNGSFDGSKKTITWKASDNAELSNLLPGQSGSVGFTIKVKEVIPVNNANDKNFIISSVAQIDSPDVPTPIDMNKIVSGNRMDTKLNSKVVLDVKGYHFDKTISNSGSIPPKVNQETTYALHFAVLNVSNDISGARLEAVLPTGVTFTGVYDPQDASINYNERTNLISWDIGNVEAGTGILSPMREAIIQVKIKPSIDLVGKEVKLINTPVLKATDAYTGNNINIFGKEKTTDLIEDGKLNYRDEVIP